MFINHNLQNRLIIFILIIIPSLTNSQQINNDRSQNNIIKHKEITITCNDNINIYGDLYATNKETHTILLFHQGGANARGEFETIIPKLLNEGFNILAVDLRVGGSSFYGGYNRTIARLKTNPFVYCDAYPDLEATLDYLITNKFTGDKILWGSSFGGALALQLASKRTKDITAILAFSPSTGNAVKDCHPNPYLESIDVPVIILRPKSEMERESSVTQFEIAKKYNHQTYIAEYGVHASSMLVEERVKNDVSENWKVVLKFLNGIKAN